MKREIKYNKSKTYLLPLLSELVILDKQFLPFLENTYMLDDKNKYNNCLYLWHDFDFTSPEFTKYESRFTNNELFVDLHDFDDKCLYIFKFPEEYLKEYDCLLNSKYSEFGEDAKELILEFWSQMYGNNPSIIPFIKKVKQILYKEEELRIEREKKLKVKIDKQSELGEFVDIVDETFNFKQFEDEIRTSKVK